MNATRSLGRRAGLATMLLALVAGVSACGAGSDGGDSASDKAGTAPVPAASEPNAPDGILDGTGRDSDSGGGTGSSDEGTKPVASTVTIPRSVIAKADLSLSTRRPDEVRRRALALVAGLSGTVDDEQSYSDGRGRVSDVDLTLRVPTASFEKALDQLAELGTLQHRERSAEDVTTQVIDLAARVKSRRDTVASFQRLLARATTIGEIMSIENQLSGRQAELDSLLQQQKYLADQTSMSTIQLHIERKRAGEDDDPAGFLGGLEDGWNALGGTAVALGTALGAALPFAAVLAIIGVPVWLIARRRRTPAGEAPAES